MKVERSKRLDEHDHRLLVLWAADCAEHVLPYFEAQYSEDDRPRKAIEAARAWARGELTMSKARHAAFAAHAAATAHVADHARHAAAYAVTTATAAAIPTDAGAATVTERDWQSQCLPEHLRPVAFPFLCGSQ
jgi:hypothetical protein